MYWIYIVSFLLGLVGVIGGVLMVLRFWVNQKFEWLEEQFEATRQENQEKVKCPLVTKTGGLVNPRRLGNAPRLGGERDEQVLQEQNAELQAKVEPSQGVKIIVGGNK